MNLLLHDIFDFGDCKSIHQILLDYNMAKAFCLFYKLEKSLREKRTYENSYRKYCIIADDGGFSLDLHGFTKTVAIQAINTFVEGSFGLGLNKFRIIYGKGKLLAPVTLSIMNSIRVHGQHPSIWQNDGDIQYYWDNNNDDEGKDLRFSKDYDKFLNELLDKHEKELEANFKHELDVAGLWKVQHLEDKMDIPCSKYGHGWAVVSSTILRQAEPVEENTRLWLRALDDISDYGKDVFAYFQALISGVIDFQQYYNRSWQESTFKELFSIFYNKREKRILTAIYGSDWKESRFQSKKKQRLKEAKEQAAWEDKKAAEVKLKPRCKSCGHEVSKDNIEKVCSVCKDKNKACFVATAVFGNSESEEVEILRTFRDNTLIKTAIGRMMISIYWQIGPILASIINKNPPSRIILVPCIKLTCRILKGIKER